ncbi:MAG: hypothetical protein ACETWC_04885 [Acidobacteriota bacterium]
MEPLSLSDIVTGAYKEIKGYVLKRIEGDLWIDFPVFRMRCIVVWC